MENRNIGPDDIILKEIFTIDLPTKTTVILQDWNKCVLKAEFSNGIEPCIVRLERVAGESRMFPMIAALQQVAAMVIPHLVPRTLQFGKAMNAEKDEFHFSVVEFIRGSTLEEVWGTLSEEERISVVEELGAALEKLHSVRPGDDNVRRVLQDMTSINMEGLGPLEQAGVFGGPELGFFQDGPSLLEAIEKSRRRKTPACTLTTGDISSGTTILSHFDEIGTATVNTSDMETWKSEAVLCHNDLTPRNLILRSCTSPTGEVRYKLAGIIDWEFSGFFPASYELSLQDTYFPTANRHVSYYLLLKEHLGKLTPRSSSHTTLSKAMDLIYESQQRSLVEGNKIPAKIRKRFLETLKMVKDEDPYVGWRRSSQETPFEELSQAEFVKLENDVIEEVVTKRKASAGTT
ncbi:hypothetical protein EJ05DRAFT_474050 [Pseudovirgaria hyperparasitica]|uniref:Aminoglycoside phosphotransferase domain-containing protein n=1 Tax=Pseudovirgaria hyperparasitica TaxID=470096 RepID=A0A6A6WD92_9PEZI|nr:uncharacterized protein EJ05DRAFT_474050 [Pseudovirgaria hyperparasitica]KAF2760149.1 hypothetical protein EJ05DRAFT_474050 [Pseudovirgaria hyperparasitica]